MTELERVKDFFKNDIYATEITGIELIEVVDNYAKCHLDITPKHMNAAGNVMGGVIFTLADFAFAVAANYNKPITVTLSSQIGYLNKIKGSQLIAEAHCTKDSKNNCFFLIEIIDNLGTHVATVTTNGYRK